jgi:DNA mismatch repair protein MutS
LLREKNQTTLNQDAPVAIAKGMLLLKLMPSWMNYAHLHSGKEFLKELKRESQLTGIFENFFNNVFGYYIEVRNCIKIRFLEWIRKQTLVNAERYITRNLRNMKLRFYEEKIHKIESDCLSNWSLDCNVHKPVQLNANLVAQLDCLCSFTQLAIENKYVCPELDESFELDIKNGRHPVIENN